MSVRVLVTDDSAFMRKMISGIIERTPGLELAGTARNGRDCLDKIRSLSPHLVTLDIEMPEMNGIDALREIMKLPEASRPVVVMCSSLTMAGSRETLAALRLGAADFIAKDLDQVRQESATFESELAAKLQALAPHDAKTNAAPPARTPMADAGTRIIKRDKEPSLRDIRAVFIGSSTGGPPVLETLVCSLGADWGLPVFIAQHMPALFSRCLAERLGAMANVEVKVAEDEERVRAGVVYVGEGGKHLRIVGGREGMRIQVSPEPADASFRPSVNELFASAATSYGSHALGLILTGMGDDGTRGAEKLFAAGAPILAQEQSTCVVYGMPKCVVNAGFASGIMSPEQMKAVLAQVGKDRAIASRRTA